MSTTNQIIKIVADTCGVTVGPNDNLNEAGIDSLDYQEVMLAVEDEFAIEISDEELGKIETAAQFAALVDALLS